MDVAYDANGTLYVADSTNDRIQRFVNGSTTGTSLSGLTINNPTAVFMTNNGILYIIDSLNYRVLRWNNGVATIVAGGHGIGSTLDKMSTSNGLYIDTNLNIYISDTANNRVTFWTAGNTTIGRLMAGGNSAGSGAHQLNSPWGIYVDANGTLYIVDSSNHRVQKWLPGKIQRWSPGSTYGITLVAVTMASPKGMTFDSIGNLVVADMSYHRIDSFSISCPQTTTTTIPPTTQSLNQVCSTAYWNSTFRIVAGSTGSYSTAMNRLYTPIDVTFDGYGYMYVVDNGNNRIQLFPPGRLNTSSMMSYPLISNLGSTSSTSAVTLAGLSTGGGNGYSELSDPYSIFVDLNGIMYILDTGNFRVVKWLPGQPLGFTVAGSGVTGTTLDKIGTSYAIYLDNQSNIYISEYGNHRITKWLNGNLTAGIRLAGNNTAGSASNQLNNPWGIFVDGNYTLYVVDRGNHRIQKWISGMFYFTSIYILIY
ncbi:unnamed protein product [Rotaria sp. Silwood1]|nr:unnamed protein product [Rotaria sp. Silwood1]